MSHGGVARRLKAGDIFYGHFTTIFLWGHQWTKIENRSSLAKLQQNKKNL